MEFAKTEIANGFYAARKPIEIWDVNVDKIVISKLVKIKTNSKYLIGYLDRDIGPLVSIMPKMSGYVKAFKVEDKTNKLMSFRIDEKLSEEYKAIWTKIKDLINIRKTRYRKTKIRAYGDNVYTNFHGLNAPEYDQECESFTVIFIDSLFVYQNKYYLQVYLKNCAYKIVKKQVVDYLDENVFED